MGAPVEATSCQPLRCSRLIFRRTEVLQKEPGAGLDLDDVLVDLALGEIEDRAVGRTFHAGETADGLDAHPDAMLDRGDDQAVGCVEIERVVGEEFERMNILTLELLPAGRKVRDSDRHLRGEGVGGDHAELVDSDAGGIRVHGEGLGNRLIDGGVVGGVRTVGEHHECRGILEQIRGLVEERHSNFSRAPCPLAILYHLM